MSEAGCVVDKYSVLSNSLGENGAECCPVAGCRVCVWSLGTGVTGYAVGERTHGWFGNTKVRSGAYCVGRGNTISEINRI